MAKVSPNAPAAHFRGKVGHLVFRQVYGETIATLLPNRADVEPSSNQLERQERFRRAQEYAKSVLKDPLKRECYRRLGAARKMPPNALLVSNRLTPPTIEHVELEGYQGRVGDRIRVLATDSIEVMDVTITVRARDGKVIESARASRDHDVWVFQASQPVSEGTCQIEIVARNRCGAEAKVVGETAIGGPGA